MPKGRRYSTAHYFPNGTIYILGGTENTNNYEFASPLLTLHLQNDFSLHPSASTNHDFLPSIGHTSHLPNNSIFSVFGLHPTQYSNSEQSPRYKHTSLLDYPYLYVIGGLSTQSHQPILDALWRHSLLDNSWISFSFIPLSGHVSFQFKHWILSCFGHQHSLLSNNCIVFDTIFANSTKIISVQDWPSSRIHATITPQGSKYILFGGKDQKGILDDVWEAQLETPLNIRWTKLEAIGHPRSGHVAIPLSQQQLILYYGGQQTLSLMADEPLYLNTTSGQWIQRRKPVYQLEVSPEAVDDQGLGGGAITGIVVGLVAAIVLGTAGFLLWKRHRSKKPANVSRATRFSQSPSHISLAEAASVSSLAPSVPQLALPELAVTTTSASQEESKTKRRMTLNLFSADREIRSSRFLQARLEPNESRTSIGGRSVSSVQWIGFNDHMDYKRDSTASIHLAVKNSANRASSHYTESTPSTPRSSLYPYHLRDSTLQGNTSRQSMAS
ncbi:hypothetical protein G6F56_007128 [Rhizopus delemar]|nr:hypothetical protein G6F56_007128 [Rhizopus delemar]